jgi:Cys-tRNA(Pro)/Cys-tRNA(Cys) deacylase
MSKVTRATKMLKQASVGFSVHTYGYDGNADRIGLQAAEAIAEVPARVLKLLMAMVDGKPVCIIINGGQRSLQCGFLRTTRRKS